MAEDQGRVRVQRALRSADEIDKHSKAFRETVFADLKARHAKLEAPFDLAAASSTASLLKPEDRDRYLRNWREEASVLRGPTLYNITVAPGDRYFGLPFDDEWSEGSGNIGSLTAKTDGELLTMNTDGFSSSGVGVFLETNSPVSVAVTAIGTHNWNWVSVTNNWNVRSQGGGGVGVTDENGEIFRRETMLWNVVGASQFTGNQWSGALENEASGSGPFGPVSLQPLYFDMYPGKTYAFWVWVWQIFQPGGDNGFLAFNSGAVKFIRVEAGPIKVIG